MCRLPDQDFLGTGLYRARDEYARLPPVGRKQWQCGLKLPDLVTAMTRPVLRRISTLVLVVRSSLTCVSTCVRMCAEEGKDAVACE
jgi:hypothetical protein